MTTDTPRTDAIAIHPACAVTSEYGALEIHARQLERENTRLREAISDALIHLVTNYDIDGRIMMHSDAAECLRAGLANDGDHQRAPDGESAP